MTMKKSTGHVAVEEHTIDEWTASSIKYRLVERGGLYRVEVWDLYRFVGFEDGLGGLQVLARRMEETRGQKVQADASASANVFPIAKGRVHP